MTSFGSFLRSAPVAVFGSAAARVHDLGLVDQMVRTPLPLSRRIGFVQLRGGSGASATAGYLANLLAARRTGPVLGIDASRGSSGMLWHAGLPATATQRSSAARASARRAREAVDGLPRAASGLWALSLANTRIAGAVASVDSWFERCSPITRFFDVVVTDWGVRAPRIDLADVAGASHVLCIVARADRHSAEQALSVVEALRSLDRAPQPVIALVDVGRTAGPAPGIVARSAGVPVVSIPYDAARASERQVASTSLATRTRLAYGRLAYELMSSAVATDPGRNADAVADVPTRGQTRSRRDARSEPVPR